MADRRCQECRDNDVDVCFHQQAGARAEATEPEFTEAECERCGNASPDCTCQQATETSPPTVAGDEGVGTTSEAKTMPAPSDSTEPTPSTGNKAGIRPHEAISDQTTYPAEACDTAYHLGELAERARIRQIIEDAALTGNWHVRHVLAAIDGGPTDA